MHLPLGHPLKLTLRQDAHIVEYMGTDWKGGGGLVHCTACSCLHSITICRWTSHKAAGHCSPTLLPGIKYDRPAR